MKSPNCYDDIPKLPPFIQNSFIRLGLPQNTGEIMLMPYQGRCNKRMKIIIILLRAFCKMSELAVSGSLSVHL